MKILRTITIEKLLATISFILLIAVIGIAAFDSLGKENVMIKVKLEEHQDPFVKLKEIVPDEASIQRVRQINRDRNEYMITFKTKRPQALLKWIAGKNGVEDATIHMVSP